ncbi:carboxypeptidase-like regulatory domain-containing protein, partial [Belliella kenyensis]|nr:carboxypeptidase-like regulatory domain-containing protein [Belliella kenyensis]
GIQERPIAGSGSLILVNQNGNFQHTVFDFAFNFLEESTDGAPGFVTAVRIVSFPIGADSFVIDGEMYTASNWPSAGVIVPTDERGSPTVEITVDPTEDNGTEVLFEYYAIDNAGFESLLPGEGFILFFPNPGFGGNNNTISGTVFNDADGSSNGINNLSGITIEGINVILIGPDIFGNEVVYNVREVSSEDGTFSFTGLSNGSYRILLTTATAEPLDPVSTVSIDLPLGWVNTGENLGTGIGNDGLADGILAVQVSGGNVSNANFGIQERPIAGSGSLTLVNQNGNFQHTVFDFAFNFLEESTDGAPGFVTAVRIVSFPIGADSFVIDGEMYTASNWPSAGVIVPTDERGSPTVEITVDPTEDNGTEVLFEYYAIDNAGFESLLPGEGFILFFPNPGFGGNNNTISGTVFNDADGASNGINNLSGITIEGINVILIGPDIFGNEVVYNVREVSSEDGTFSFTGLSNGSYRILLTTATAEPLDPVSTVSIDLPLGWLNTGENLGTGIGNDGVVDGILAVQVSGGNVSNANFGIQERPVAGSGIHEAFNPNGNIQLPVPPTAFTNGDGIIANPSTDGAPGFVRGIRITSYPTGVASIVINGVSYSSGVDSDIASLIA